MQNGSGDSFFRSLREQRGSELLREGSNHSIYVNRTAGKTSQAAGKVVKADSPRAEAREE